MKADASRWIMHLDMDAFYAAIEQRDDPALRGRPVVVGAQPGGRGVVATCSYEARRFGVRSAMPINEAHRRCPQAVFLRPRMGHYRAVSQEVRDLLAKQVPVIEPISIDEVFLDITDLVDRPGSPWDIGRRLKAAIQAAVGLTASIGVGPNRLVAKIASDAEKPDGLVVIAPEAVQGFLDPLPIAVLRGVGSRTRPKLERLGIRTVADLRGWPPAALQDLLGPRQALDLYRQAHGIASDRVGERAPRKSLSQERTFGQDITDLGAVRANLVELAEQVAAAACQEGIAGRVLRLKIRFRGFETHTRQRQLGRRCREPATLFAAAWSLYETGGWHGRPIRLLGLGLADLGPPEPAQPDLFADLDGDQAPRNADERSERLMATLDRIEARFGAGAIRRGAGAPKDR